VSDFAGAARAAGALACGVLGWRVEDFWAATPADLLMAVEARAAPPGDAVGRGELRDMMERDGGRRA